MNNNLSYSHNIVMKHNIRTDIAYEEILNKADNEYYQHTTKYYKTIAVNEVDILKKSEVIDKEVGKYTTIEFEHLNDQKNREEVTEVFTECMKSILKPHHRKILIAGLGNRQVSADTLGPKVCDKLFVTSHLYRLHEYEMIEGTKEVAVIVPGVMGQTGLETQSIIYSVIQNYRPDLLIVIDSLATRSLTRVNRMIQLTDTGIKPGSGVGNYRHTINKQSMKVDVLAIGVATVVSVEALLSEMLELTNHIQFRDSMLTALKEQEYQTMIVTPKEIDEEMNHLSTVLANGINRSLHERVEQL